jgi:membrane protease YdiL (CAAX protease family)
MDTLLNFLVLVPLIGAVYGLVWWAKRAESDRSAFVGLYLLFGIPGGLLSVAGLALVVNETSGGWLIMGLGLALVLPLIKPFRALLGRVTPMDASSPIDMMGLGIILAVSVYFGYSLIAAPVQPGDLEPASIGALIVNVITFAALGYFAVGLFVYRSPRQATSRLGLTVPKPTDVLVGLVTVIPAFLLSFIGSLLTVAFQPDVLDSLTETTQDLTSGIQTPIGALVLGASTGIGEELLFRGAIQPRYGIILTSALWALLHTQYQFSFVILGLFGVGILFGLIRKYVGTTAVVIAHAVYNIAVVSLQTLAT